jgi:hypothetical protein
MNDRQEGRDGPDGRRATGAILLTALLAATAIRCRAPADPPASAGSVSPPPATPVAVPHGDHNPHHGGVVMMKGDLHYEVVLDAAGGSHQLFFSDAVREDLPASIASSVALTIRRPGSADEMIPLQIDSAGESWIGSGRPIGAPSQATARIAFTIRGEPYWIDVPVGTARRAPL